MDNKRLELLDTIQLKSNNEYLMIDDWRVLHKDLIFEDGFEFVLEHGVLDVVFEGTKYEFEKEGDFVNVIVYVDANFGSMSGTKTYEKMISYTINLSAGCNELNTNLQEYTGVKNPLLRKEVMHKAKELMNVSMARLCTVMMFITHYSDAVEVAEVTERQPLNKKEERLVNKAKYRSNQPIKLTRTVFRFGNTDKEGNRGYTKYSHEFTVRGHFRNYKSGKRVWIQPFTKGQGEKHPKKYSL